MFSYTHMVHHWFAKKRHVLKRWFGHILLGVGVAFLLIIAHDAAIAAAMAPVLRDARTHVNALQTAWAKQDYETVRALIPATADTAIAMKSMTNALWVPRLIPRGAEAQQNVAQTLDKVSVLSEKAEQVPSGQEAAFAAIAKDVVSLVPVGVAGSPIDSVTGYLQWFSNESKQDSYLTNITGDSGYSIHDFGKDAWHSPYDSLGATDLLAVTSYVTSTTPKRLLVLFANPSELRPAGGFFGSYAVIRLGGGVAVESFDDIYNLDRPAEAAGFHPGTSGGWAETFPQDQQYLRDRNWNIDGAITLSEARRMFALEWRAAHPNISVPDIQGVAVITPEAVRPLFELAGSVQVEGIAFTPEQFDAILQYKVQQDFWKEGKTEQQRKNIMGSLGKALVKKLVDLGPSGYLKISDIIQDALRQKDAYIMVDDQRVQDVLQASGWSNLLPVKDANADIADIFGVFDGNTKAQKTDSVIDKRITYSVHMVKDGSVMRPEAVAALSYTHTSAVYSWLISPYRSRTSVLAPSGVTDITVEERDTQGNVRQLAFTTDMLGTSTVIRFPVALEKLESKTYMVRYRLPYQLSPYTGAKYVLRWQAQPGERLGTVTRGVYPDPVERVHVTDVPLVTEWVGKGGGVRVSGDGLGDAYIKLEWNPNDAWKTR